MEELRKASRRCVHCVAPSVDLPLAWMEVLTVIVVHGSTATRFLCPGLHRRPAPPSQKGTCLPRVFLIAEWGHLPNSVLYRASAGAVKPFGSRPLSSQAASELPALRLAPKLKVTAASGFHTEGWTPQNVSVDPLCIIWCHIYTITFTRGVSAVQKVSALLELLPGQLQTPRSSSKEAAAQNGRGTFRFSCSKAGVTWMRFSSDTQKLTILTWRARVTPKSSDTH